MSSTLRTYLILFVITAITTGASVLYLSRVAETNDTTLTQGYPGISTGMAREYATLSINLVEHHVFSLATTTPFTPDAWRTPGYPVFIAFFYALFGSFFPVLVAQSLLLFLTVLLIYNMALKLMPSAWALALSVLYLLLPGTILSASVLLSESVFVFLLVLAIYLCFFSEWKRLYVRWALAGLLFATTVYVRPASQYILFFIIPAYLVLYTPRSELGRRHFVAAGLMAIVFVLSLLPWCFRNQQQLDTFSFASTGAFVLFRQNATQFYEAYNDVQNLEARYALLDRAGIPRGPVPTDPKYSATLQRVAVEVIAEHPFRYALFHLTTFIPFFTSSSAHTYWRFVQDMRPNIIIPEEPSLIQAIHPFSLPLFLTVLKNHGWTLVENAFWGIVTILMLASLWYSRNVRLTLLFFAITLYFAAVTGPIAHARYRVPVEPFILLSAFSGAAYLWQRLQWKWTTELPGSRI